MIDEPARLLARTGKCLDHPKLQVSDSDAKALRDHLITALQAADAVEVAREALGRIDAALPPGKCNSDGWYSEPIHCDDAAMVRHALKALAALPKEGV